MGSFKLDMNKLDKLADDLKKLEMPRVTKTSKDGGGAVPMFQCKGYLEKLSQKGSKWYKRFFVLRDSFLLSYNLAKSDFTVEPNKSIHLVKCKLEMFSEGAREFCFAITTQDKDRFVLAAESAKDRAAWRKDIEIGRIISHKNMVKLAVENQCLAEEKGIAAIMKQHSVSALSVFSNQEYIKKTPLTGGAEGWLMSPGFCVEQKNKKDLKKSYFMLKDSHLLMFASGDVLKKPRGCMYLVGTSIKVVDAMSDGEFKFILFSKECADYIQLVASTEAQRVRWSNALKIGARVTYGDFKLLLKEHEILQNADTGASDVPDASEEIDLSANDIDEKAIATAADTGLVGDELEPGTQQPYDAQGNPIIRDAQGKLVDASGTEVAPKTARFNAQGDQLDAFNRPLPDGAVPMFTAEGVAIGVGPDGKHYLPDGTEIAKSAPHFDADGKKIQKDVVDKAEGIAETINVQVKARAKMRPEGAAAEEVDALGRTFRGTKDGDTLVNADGQEVPALTARRVVNDAGELTDAAAPARESKQGTLVIKMENEDGASVVGEVEINEYTTLADVRRQIDADMSKTFDSFVFLVNHIAVTRTEEIDLLATNCLPEVMVRGIELKKVSAPKFSKKLSAYSKQQEQTAKQEAEFNDMMAKIRAGNFLKKTKPLGE